MSVERLSVTLTEKRSVLRRAQGHALEASDWPVVIALMSQDVARTERRMAKALAKLAAQAQESESEVDDDAEDDEDGECLGPESTGPVTEGCDTPNSSTSSSTNTSGSGPRAPKPKPPGHGRNGASAYINAKQRVHVLCAGILGALCQACNLGRMMRYRDKLIVLVKGQPPFDAEVHRYEQVRCRLCGAIIRAEGAGVTEGLGSSYITYDWSACAMLLVMHYFAGMPFKRLESLQAGWGIPMPDANQWSLADQSDDLLFPLYKALEKHGVNNALALRIDDTGSMVIDKQREIRAEIAALEARGESTKDVRTGINATGVYLETTQGKVLLFFTGRHHAGEVIDRILTHRSASQHSDKLVKVSDAASKNFVHSHHDELEEAVCNAHAYLKFRAVKDRYPEPYSLAGEVYKAVFDNDDTAKAQGMSPQQRMLYHREHSLPQMKRLKKMCHEMLQSHLVEPNSPLWEPLTFIINQWDRLTKFCNVPGVPLDSNVVEQMLIIPVRYLAGSFNYQTQDGADVGDRHMSLITTANVNGVEPVAYLTDCLRNHEDLKTRPEHYLPWVYRERLAAHADSMQTCSRPEASSQPRGRAVEHPLRPGTQRRPTQGATDPPATTTARP